MVVSRKNVKVLGSTYQIDTNNITWHCLLFLQITFAQYQGLTLQKRKTLQRVKNWSNESPSNLLIDFISTPYEGNLSKMTKHWIRFLSHSIRLFITTHQGTDSLSTVWSLKFNSYDVFPRSSVGLILLGCINTMPWRVPQRPKTCPLGWCMSLLKMTKGCLKTQHRSHIMYGLVLNHNLYYWLYLSYQLAHFFIRNLYVVLQIEHDIKVLGIMGGLRSMGGGSGYGWARQDEHMKYMDGVRYNCVQVQVGDQQWIFQGLTAL